MPMLERYLVSSVTSFFQKMTSLMMSFPAQHCMGRAGDQQKNDAQAGHGPRRASTAAKALAKLDSGVIKAL